MSATSPRLLALTLASAVCLGQAVAGDEEGKPLEGPEWEALATVTAFHSVKLRQSGFEARLLEADGSGSVAQDPIGLLRRVGQVPAGRPSCNHRRAGAEFSR